MSQLPIDLIDELVACFGVLSEDALSRAEQFATELEQLGVTNGRRHIFAQLTDTTNGKTKVGWCVHREANSARRLAAGDKIIVRSAAGIDIGTVHTHLRNGGQLVKWQRAGTVTRETFDDIISAEGFSRAVRLAAERRSLHISRPIETPRAAKSAFLASLPATTAAVGEICQGLCAIATAVFAGIHCMTIGSVAALALDLHDMAGAVFRRHERK